MWIVGHFSAWLQKTSKDYHCFYILLVTGQGFILENIAKRLDYAAVQVLFGLHIQVSNSA